MPELLWCHPIVYIKSPPVICALGALRVSGFWCCLWWYTSKYKKDALVMRCWNRRRRRDNARPRIIIHGQLICRNLCEMIVFSDNVQAMYRREGYNGKCIYTFSWFLLPRRMRVSHWRLAVICIRKVAIEEIVLWGSRNVWNINSETYNLNQLIMYFRKKPFLGYFYSYLLHIVSQQLYPDHPHPNSNFT